MEENCCFLFKFLRKMDKDQLRVIGNICLGLGSGLFTGGVVSSIIAEGYATDILFKLYIPAMIFYFAYILSYILRNQKLRWKDPFVWVSVFVLVLSGIYFIWF